MDSNYGCQFFESGCGADYKDKEYWTEFFGGIADKIVELFHPSTVLDAGCAFGYLVGELRKRGVEAYGFDVSPYAISKVEEKYQSYCFVHDITKPLPEHVPQKYDVIVNMEVLEHLQPEGSEQGVRNLCQYTDRILFSSTPYDVENETHYNVRFGEYWVRLFAQNSFYRNLVTDVTFICPWAMLFEKRQVKDFPDIVCQYEIQDRIYKMRERKIQSSLFYDEGSGFTEEKKTVVEADWNQENYSAELIIDSEKGKLRFDIVEGSGCLIWKMEVWLDDERVECFPMNGEIVGEFWLFTEKDPQIEIKIPPFISMKNRKLIIQCKLVLFESRDFLECMKSFVHIRKEEGESIRILKQNREKLLLELDAKNRQIEILEQENQNFTAQLKDIEAENQEIKSSSCWKMTAPLRKMLDLVKKH